MNVEETLPNSDQNFSEVDLEEIRDEDEIELENSLQQLAEQTESAPENQPVQPDQPVPTQTAPDLNHLAKIEALISESVGLRAQLDDRQAQYARLYADFENFRKRTLREKEEEEEKNTSKILKKFLPVVDDFERAKLQIKPKTDAEANIHNSYQSVYKQLVKCLQEVGLVRMETVGQEFDPNLHEAIAQEPTSEFAEGAVMAELRSGFLLADKVLRHALVKVAAAPSEES
ncbi:MAG: nucleotide exchange factor GrpE [Pseudanabaenaceae cyanobacterium bins.68]|nr:nucleotide exchange factor GrpE [Pseudanabaenaceae cyanobacterium bins.68]